jgi:uracil-DNA glycosylase family 4
MNTTAKQKELDKITADMLESHMCAELAASATNIVPGEGNPDADVVLIGEAPGRQEDLTGMPFVGAAGKLLTELLDSAGFKREDVFITSIVKYRPPNNRDPKPSEKEESWPYLLRQLRVIQPKLVVTLGRHSMGYFVPNQTITEAHGKLIEGGEWPVLPVYHPAAALYNNNLRVVLQEDFAALAAALKNLERKQ